MWSSKSILVCLAAVSVALFSFILGVRWFPDHADVIQTICLLASLSVAALVRP